MQEASPEFKQLAAAFFGGQEVDEDCGVVYKSRKPSDFIYSDDSEPTIEDHSKYNITFGEGEKIDILGGSVAEADTLSVFLVDSIMSASIEMMVAGNSTYKQMRVSRGAERNALSAKLEYLEEQWEHGRSGAWEKNGALIWVRPNENCRYLYGPILRHIVDSEAEEDTVEGPQPDSLGADGIRPEGEAKSSKAKRKRKPKPKKPAAESSESKDALEGPENRVEGDTQTWHSEQPSMASTLEEPHSNPVNSKKKGGKKHGAKHGRSFSHRQGTSAADRDIDDLPANTAVDEDPSEAHEKPFEADSSCYTDENVLADAPESPQMNQISSITLDSIPELPTTTKVDTVEPAVHSDRLVAENAEGTTAAIPSIDTGEPSGLPGEVNRDKIQVDTSNSGWKQSKKRKGRKAITSNASTSLEAELPSSVTDSGGESKKVVTAQSFSVVNKIDSSELKPLAEQSRTNPKLDHSSSNAEIHKGKTQKSELPANKAVLKGEEQETVNNMTANNSSSAGFSVLSNTVAGTQDTSCQNGTTTSEQMGVVLGQDSIPAQGTAVKDFRVMALQFGDMPIGSGLELPQQVSRQPGIVHPVNAPSNGGSHFRVVRSESVPTEQSRSPPQSRYASSQYYASSSGFDGEVPIESPKEQQSLAAQSYASSSYSVASTLYPPSGNSTELPTHGEYEQQNHGYTGEQNNHPRPVTQSNQVLQQDNSSGNGEPPPPPFTCSCCRITRRPTTVAPMYFCSFCGPSTNIRYCSRACILADAFDHTYHCVNWPASETFTVFTPPSEYVFDKDALLTLQEWGERSRELHRQKTFSMYCFSGQFPEIRNAWVKKVESRAGTCADGLQEASAKVAGDYHIFRSEVSATGKFCPSEVITVSFLFLAAFNSATNNNITDIPHPRSRSLEARIQPSSERLFHGC